VRVQRVNWLHSFAERVLMIAATSGVMNAVAIWIADSTLPGDNGAKPRNRR
jgi:hypothetical protein